MKTWGISGPQFLLLYVALFGVTLLGVVLARRRVLAVPDGSAVTPSRLDPYEAAYLNGGGSLVAATAFSSLLRGGFVANTARRGRWVRLAATRAAPPAGTHPVEWVAYQVVAANPDRTLGDLQVALAREPAVAALRERLRLAGLAPSPEQRARYRAMALWFVPLAALGVIRVAAGSANGRPVGFLVALVAATVVVAVVLAVRVPQATELGRRTWAWPRPCSGPGSCGPPTPRRRWPCASRASTAPSAASTSAVGTAGAAAAAAAGAAAAGAAAAGAADEPVRGRDRLAAGAGRVRGAAPGAGVRRGGGRGYPRRPAAARGAGGPAGPGGAGGAARGPAVAGIGRGARPAAGRASGGPGRAAGGRRWSPSTWPSCGAAG
jgi:uncharacterized protein (TIGR04222 family)